VLRRALYRRGKAVAWPGRARGAHATGGSGKNLGVDSVGGIRGEPLAALLDETCRAGRGGRKLADVRRATLWWRCAWR
jgi:hypothetical protein